MTTTSMRQRLLGTTIISGALAAALAASPALAQTPVPVEEPVVGSDADAVEAAADAADNEVEGVVVTGSRIVRQDYVSNSPIATVTGEQVVQNADVTLDTFINNLPQVNPGGTTTSNNPGNNGQANIDLRGLGFNRNLVLVDGRRPMVSSNNLAVDVNIIPAAMIQSIEVITGGAGAAYGADAVAGAVNIRLRKNFEGVDLRASYQNSTEFWDASEYNFSAVVGGRFAEGRGHALLGFDRSYREPLIKSQRPFAAIATSTTSFMPEGAFFFAGTNAPTEAAYDAIFASYGVPAANVTLQSGRTGFNLDGTLIYYGQFNSPLDVQNFRYPIDLNVNTRVFPDIYSFNFDFVNLLVLPLDRYSFLTDFEYEFTNGIEVFAQAGWTEYTSATALAPTPISTVTGAAPGFATAIQYTSPLITPGSTLVNLLVVPTTNPFIPADFRQLLNSRTGDNPSIVGAGATEPFTLRQRTLDLGLRNETYENTVVQFLGGVRVPLDQNDNWRLEAYLSEGRTEITQTQTGNVDTNRLQQLLEAADGGNSLCAGGFNPFGRQPVSDACAAFLEVQSSQNTDMVFNVAQAFVSGNVTELPAGPLGFVFGAEFRGFDYAFDPGSASGPISGFNAQNPEEGSNSFHDLFTEALIPLVADVPWVKRLELSLGYRYSFSKFVDDFNGVEGETVGSPSYKAELNWEVIDALRLRGSYQRSVRAPNFSELFAGGGAAPQYFDPCSASTEARRGPNAAQLRALCIATGVSGVDNYAQTPGNQLNITTAGNTNLAPEKANTLTVGAVFSSPYESRWLERFRGSVDYYKIQIEDAILTPTPNLILAGCYNYFGGNPTYSATNPNCQAVFRQGGDVLGLLGTFPNSNVGRQETSGIDFQLDYGFDWDWMGAPTWMGRVQANLLVTHLLEFIQEDTLGVPEIDYAGTVGYFGAGASAAMLSTTYPEWKGVANVQWDLGPLNLGARIRYIGAMENRLNRQFPGETSFTGVPSVTYYDFSAGYQLTDNVELRLGLNNAFDKQPPVYQPNVQSGTDPATYDVAGRRVFGQVALRF